MVLNRYQTPLIVAFFCLMTCASVAQIDFAAEAAKTDISSLPYPVNKIVIRAFDAEDPPPRLQAPERPLFYGYGLTAYYQNADSLNFFRIQSLDAVHLDEEGNTLHSYKLSGSRYTDSFKSFFLTGITSEEKKNIVLRNIYIKDKKGNFIHLKDDQKWCPNCE